MLDVNEIKQNFSMFNQNPKLVYLDSSATALTPDSVVAAMSDYYLRYRSSINRGKYQLSQQASNNYENARANIANFFNAQTDEIIFTKSTTASINNVTHSIERLIEANSEIVITNMEHHSNFLPWLVLSKKTGAKLVIVEADETMQIKTEDVLEKLNENTKIVAIHHVSNVVGDVVDVKAICNECSSRNIMTLIDGAQAAAHLAIDLKDINCSFYTMSAHKMLGPTGLGVIYIKKEIQSQIDPFEYGGDMVSSTSVDIDNFITEDSTRKFEAGTPSIAEVIGFSKAIDLLREIGMDAIHAHEISLKKYAIEQLKKIEQKVEIYNAHIENGIIIFNIKNVAVHDAVTSSMLSDVTFDAFHVAIRDGQHCNNLTMHYVINQKAVLRASFYLYNTTNDVDKLIEAINAIYDEWN